MWASHFFILIFHPTCFIRKNELQLQVGTKNVRCSRFYQNNIIINNKRFSEVTGYLDIFNFIEAIKN